MNLHGIQITWLGHGTFKLRTAEGKSLLIDPWVMGNPACPEDQKQVEKLDLMLVTHGHYDHIGDVLQVAKEAQPDQTIAVFELATWLENKGVENTVGMNKGGTLDLGWVKITMVHADHSCGILDGDEIVYGGEAVGYVLAFASGLRLYAAGDTNVFGDMRLISQLYQPEIAILPIGDLYTMGPREAAFAAQMLYVSGIIPAHFGTFPALTGTPDALRAQLAEMGQNRVEVAQVAPGQTLS